MAKIVKFTDRNNGLPVFLNVDQLQHCFVASAQGGGSDIYVLNDKFVHELIFRVHETPKQVNAALSTKPSNLDIVLAGACIILFLCALVL